MMLRDKYPFLLEELQFRVNYLNFCEATLVKNTQ